MVVKNKTILSEQLLEILLKSPSATAFMRAGIEHIRANQPSFSYTTFAKKAGFASRSYARMCIVGERPITEKSLPKMLKGFDLQGDAARYFTLLAQQAPHQEMQRLKLKILKKHQASQQKFATPDAYKMQQWPVIYAALGDTKIGASLNDIVAKTGLSVSACQGILQSLTELAAVRHEDNRYYAQDPHIFISKLGSLQAFKEYFIWSLTQLASAAKRSFERDDHLFLSSSFSVDKSQLPAIKLRLQHLIRDSVIDMESAKGEEIVTLSLGFFPQRPTTTPQGTSP